MKAKSLLKIVFALTTILMMSISAVAQDATGQENGEQKILEGMTLRANDMDTVISNRITRVAEIFHEQKSAGAVERGFIRDAVRDAKFSLGNSLISLAVTEIFSISKYKKQQRANWETMIRNECNYTDSILSIQGNTDFYSENSFFGPLDPSNLNFDGITLTNTREGKQFFYVECHIDTTRIEHLFRHSKFYLVLDSVYFNPYLCHLPNLKANNIDKSKIKEPKRNLNFSFNDRSNLCVSVDLTLTSSWINEAVMVMQDVELGKFSFKVDIPSTEEGQPYTYSRATTKDTIKISGESFLVPRSYMPLADDVRMWGTGEYKVKVKFRESCSFPPLDDHPSADDEDTNSDFNWKDDYKELCKMQDKSSGTKEILETMCKQDGNTLMKTVATSVLTSAAEGVDLIESTSGGMP